MKDLKNPPSRGKRRQGGVVENKSLVSVIIPVYNCEKYLGEAINSVLAQSYRPLEIIVVDDGSTDGSADVAMRLGGQVRCELRAHEGLGAAQNHGVNAATGDFLSFLDADDLWMGDKLARQMACLGDAPELDMVFGYVQQFHSPELDEDARARIGRAGKVMAGLSTGTLLIRRESFFHVGLFATDLRLGQFIDWYAKALESGLKGLVLPEVMMKRRLHTSNTGIRERYARNDYAKILKASLDRRRAGTRM